jgi:hypothetical protein
LSRRQTQNLDLSWIRSPGLCCRSKFLCSNCFDSHIVYRSIFRWGWGECCNFLRSNWRLHIFIWLGLLGSNTCTSSPGWFR